MSQPDSSATGETHLSRLLQSMSPILSDGIFVFVTVSPPAAAPIWAEAVGLFREQEGVTLILPIDVATRLDWPAYPRWRLITLTVHSSLEAVGFLAAVTEALAAKGISVNPVSGYYHDHLFVPEAKAEAALEVLATLARKSAGP